MFRRFWSKIQAIGVALQSILLLVIRLYWGYQFFTTGLGKLQHLDNVAGYFQSLGIPFAYANALLAGSTEMIGGILLFFGLFARIAAIPLFVVMCVAYLSASRDALVQLFTEFNPDPFFQATPFLFLYAIAIVFCFGPGKISLDYFVTGAYKTKAMT